ncbi:MAG: hypothetical protein WB368_07020, partial [Candidatus Sulfotelmatobacter sp.]
MTDRWEIGPCAQEDRFGGGGPGLKPGSSCRRVQGPEGPCSFRWVAQGLKPADFWTVCGMAEAKP